MIFDYRYRHVQKASCIHLLRFHFGAICTVVFDNPVGMRAGGNVRDLTVQFVAYFRDLVIDRVEIVKEHLQVVGEKERAHDAPKSSIHFVPKSSAN